MVIQSNKNYHKRQKTSKRLQKLNNQEKLINYRKLNFRGGNNVDYNFSNFRPLRELFRAICYGEILIPVAEREQDGFDDVLKILKIYNPRKNSKYKKEKQDLLINSQNFFDGREMIIKAFKDEIFPIKILVSMLIIIQKKIYHQEVKVLMYHKKVQVVQVVLLINLISFLLRQKKN